MLAWQDRVREGVCSSTLLGAWCKDEDMERGADLRSKEGEGVDTAPLLEEGVQHCQGQLRSVPAAGSVQWLAAHPMAGASLHCAGGGARLCLTPHRRRNLVH